MKGSFDLRRGVLICAASLNKNGSGGRIIREKTKQDCLVGETRPGFLAEIKCHSISQRRMHLCRHVYVQKVRTEPWMYEGPRSEPRRRSRVGEWGGIPDMSESRRGGWKKRREGTILACVALGDEGRGQENEDVPHSGSERTAKQDWSAGNYGIVHREEERQSDEERGRGREEIIQGMPSWTHIRGRIGKFEGWGCFVKSQTYGGEKFSG